MRFPDLVSCCKCHIEDEGDIETKNNDECVKEKVEKGPYVGCRHVQMFLYFLVMMFSYCMRSVLSVAIVAMNDNSTSPNQDVPVYHWTDQSIVLATFFGGYIVFQIPAAYFGKKYGIKWILVGSTILDSTSCILIPTMANYFGSKGVMVCRFLQGLAQGFLLPSIHTLLGHWAPPSERSRIGTFAYAGSVFGNIVSMPITGVISSSWVGWPFSFYLWGFFGLSWSFIWIIFGYEKPKSHNSITKIEKDYIEKSLGHSEEKQNESIPWKDILSSSPVWALIIANLGVNWGSSILLTQTPTYLNKILKYDMQPNAALSAAPYLAMWVCSFIFSTACDFIINENWITRGCARKIFNSIGTLCPALGLLYLGFTPKDPYLSVGILIVVGGTIGAGFCGFQVNHIDLSPNHSGILIALSNGCTSVFSAISPLVVHFVVADQTDQEQWRIIFIVSAAVYASTDLFFIYFASGEVQEWNEKCDNHEIIEDKYTPKTDL